MRWLLLPLLLLALAAPRAECERRLIIYRGNQVVAPPLPLGTPGAWLGTDPDGRDLGCLVSRGLRRSLGVVGLVFAAGVLPGVLLGLALGWRGWALGLPGEPFVLAGLLLFLGGGAYRLVLAFGLALVVARLVAVPVRAILLEPFLEGARALGGGSVHVLRRHVLPHLAPRLPGVLAAALGAGFLWTAELGALGFYDRGGYTINLSDDPGRPVPTFIATDPDLGQTIAFLRWSWLTTPEQLFLPALLLVLLSLALADLARVLGTRGNRPRARPEAAG